MRLPEREALELAKTRLDANDRHVGGMKFVIRCFAEGYNACSDRLRARFVWFVGRFEGCDGRCAIRRVILVEMASSEVNKPRPVHPPPKVTLDQDPLSPGHEK